MTYEVQQTRWDRIVRRVSGSIGPGSRVSETLSELFPVLDVERVPPELLILGGTHMAQGRTDEVGIAANVQQAMLRNPGQSGTIITLTRITVQSSTPQDIFLGPTLNTFANANPVAFVDTRIFGAGNNPVGQVLDGIALVSAPDFYRMRSGAASAYEVYEPQAAIAVLGPGTAYAVSGSSLNTQMSVTFDWRERPAEESELSL